MYGPPLHCTICEMLSGLILEDGPWQSHKHDETSTDCKVCCRRPATKDCSVDRRILRDANSPQEERQWAGRSLRTSLLLIPLTPTWLTLAFLPSRESNQPPSQPLAFAHWQSSEQESMEQLRDNTLIGESPSRVDDTSSHVTWDLRWALTVAGLMFLCCEKWEQSTVHVSFTGSRLWLSLFSKPFFLLHPVPSDLIGIEFKWISHFRHNYLRREA